jgi:hypothetical protein
MDDGQQRRGLDRAVRGTEPADPAKAVPLEKFEVGHEATTGRGRGGCPPSPEYDARILRRRSMSIGAVNLPVFVF